MRIFFCHTIINFYNIGFFFIPSCGRGRDGGNSTKNPLLNANLDNGDAHQRIGEDYQTNF